MKGITLANFTRIVIVMGVSLALLGLMSALLGGQILPVRAADTIIVDRATGSDAASCGSMLAPCYSIAYAVANWVVSGDVVFVQAGVYTEPVAMVAGVVISGAGASTTFIDGEGVRGPMLTAGSGITESAVLRGITIRRGRSSANGGGVSITDGGSPLIESCVITNNHATGDGGGIYIDASSPTISNTQILSNAAVGNGGGLYVVDSLTLTQVTMKANTSAQRGGGIYQHELSAWLILSEGYFEANVAQSDGGGVFVRGSAIVSGSQFIRNTSGRAGGGLYVNNDMVVTNVQAIRNVAGQWGGGLYQNLFDNLVKVTGGRLEGNWLTDAGSYAGGLFASDEAMVIGTEVISNYADHGGGMHLSSGGTVSGVLVLSNTARSDGGGLHQDYLRSDKDDANLWMNVINTRFENNQVLNGIGGGAYIAGNGALTRTQVISNRASGSGGGVYVEYQLILGDAHILSNTASSGGGIYQQSTTVKTEGWGGRVQNNVASGAGGGLYHRGRLTLSGTQILSNTAAVGGGALVYTATLNQVTVQGNTAGNDGGGLYFPGPTNRLDAVGGSFAGNSARNGGGVYAMGATYFTGTQIVKNVATTHGGGIYADRDVRATNVLLAANTSASGGDGVYLGGADGTQVLNHVTIASPTVSSHSAIFVLSGTVSIINSMVASHTIGIRQTDGVLNEDYNLSFGNGTAVNSRGGTFNGGANSISGLDPRFVNPSGGDYHIEMASAALDRGAFIGVLDDVDGDARQTNAAQPDAPDIGYDENRAATVYRTISDTMTFGATNVRIVFTDTGLLTGLTVTRTDNPSFGGGSPNAQLLYYYTITPHGSGPYTATLSVGYTGAKISETEMDESALDLYRYADANWHIYTSTVDTTSNVVTATGIVTFSSWALGAAVPTAVDVATFTVTPVVNGILLAWETASETDNAGFNLYRLDNATGASVRLNEKLILSQMPGSLVGTQYQWIDQDAALSTPYTYWLEDINMRGMATSHEAVSVMLVETGLTTIYLPPVLR